MITDRSRPVRLHVGSVADHTGSHLWHRADGTMGGCVPFPYRRNLRNRYAAIDEQADQTLGTTRGEQFEIEGRAVSNPKSVEDVFVEELSELVEDRVSKGLSRRDAARLLQDEAEAQTAAAITDARSSLESEGEP